MMLGLEQPASTCKGTAFFRWKRKEPLHHDAENNVRKLGGDLVHLCGR